MRRVAVTGMAGLSPLGNSWQEVSARLRRLESAVRTMPEWDGINGLRTRLGTQVTDFSLPEHYDRRRTRSMGRVALLAARATELAIEDAGLSGDQSITNGATGIAYGSSTGSPEAIAPYARMVGDRSMRGITATSYIQMMSHTCAANLGQFFGVKGRIIPTCSACTSGSQGIGYAYEAIKFGKQDVMLAGGAEELSVTEAAVFDVLFVASTKNDTPRETPSPFDVGRDGLVIGEGAATLVLEEWERARARGARIYAELIGFGTNADGVHITNPSPEGMGRVMELALEDARLEPGRIGYVNAHGTGTELGDIAESEATQRIFGSKMPISSLKSYMGHTLGASGALEAWMTIHMMLQDWYAPTLNLKQVDPRCGELDYLQGEGREFQCEFVMSNNFAFGGINTSLIFRRV